MILDLAYVNSAGWRKSHPLVELSLICLLKNLLKSCILSLLGCRVCGLGTHPSSLQAFRVSIYFGWGTVKSFSLPGILKMVVYLCWNQPDSPQWRRLSSASEQWTDVVLYGLSCHFWRDLSYWNFFPILDSVNFAGPSEHRFSTVTLAVLISSILVASPGLMWWLYLSLIHSYLPAAAAVWSLLWSSLSASNGGPESSVMAKFSLKNHKLLSWWAASRL